MADLQFKQLYYFLAVKEILELFGEQELGSQCEIDIESVCSYISSFKFAADTYGVRTKEAIYQMVTDDILAGYPVWKLLKLSDWKRDMLERELRIEQEEYQKQLEKTYKCYTCQHFKEDYTTIGVHLECTFKKDDRFKLKRNEGFEPVKRCKNYVRRKDDSSSAE